MGGGSRLMALGMVALPWLACAPLDLDDLPTRTAGVVTPTVNTPEPTSSTSTPTSPDGTPTTPTTGSPTPTPSTQTPTRPGGPTPTAPPTPTAEVTPTATLPPRTLPPPTPTPATPFPDADADTYPADVDCNDGDPSVHPEALETCDSRDEDCDEAVDEDAGAPVFPDADQDGYGVDAGGTLSCTLPEGYAAQSGDCAPADASVNPGAPEECDGADQDCDASIDEGVLQTFYADADGDDWGDPDNAVSGCTAPEGYGANASDCDDSNPKVFPGAPFEYQDGLDNNCNGREDEIERGDTANLVLTGSSDNAWYGSVLRGLGDFDGDGHQDLAVAAPFEEGGRGQVSLLYGRRERISESARPDIVTLRGDGTVSTAGSAVAAGRDFDGDGRPDLAVGQPGIVAGSGRVSLIFGSTSRLPNGALLEQHGVSLYGGLAVLLGTSLAFADLDADGKADLLAGAPWYDGADGAVYLVYGQEVERQPAPVYVDIRTIGTPLTGQLEGGRLGWTLSHIGDFDGDGYEDAVTGSPDADVFIDEGDVCEDCGGVAILYGGRRQDIGTQGRVGQIAGEDDGEGFGMTVAALGDLDNDGYDDFIAGAPDNDRGGDGAGAAYVIFGGPERWTGGRRVGELGDRGGPILFTDTDGGQLGHLNTSFGVGDVDGDGTLDLTVGSLGTALSGSETGIVGLFLGSGDLTSNEPRLLTSAEALFEGSHPGDGMSSGSFIGDIDGDGHADLLLGAFLARVGENKRPGEARLYYGY